MRVRLLVSGAALLNFLKSISVSATVWNKVRNLASGDTALALSICDLETFEPCGLVDAAINSSLRGGATSAWHSRRRPGTRPLTRCFPVRVHFGDPDSHSAERYCTVCISLIAQVFFLLRYATDALDEVGAKLTVGQTPRAAQGRAMDLASRPYRLLHASQVRLAHSVSLARFLIVHQSRSSHRPGTPHMSLFS